MTWAELIANAIIGVPCLARDMGRKDNAVPDRTAVPHRVHEGIIVCSDRRLRPTLDRLHNNGHRVIVSTAGANVRAVSETIRGLTAQGIRRWMVLSHTDTVDIAKGCGWAGRLEIELQAGPDRAALPARYIEAATVEQFVKQGYTTRTLIESHNLEVQTAALRAVLENTHAHVERGTTLDTSTMLTDDLLGHVLVITSPSVVKYSSLIGVLNARGFRARRHLAPSRSLCRPRRVPERPRG